MKKVSLSTRAGAVSSAGIETRQGLPFTNVEPSVNISATSDTTATQSLDSQAILALGHLKANETNARLMVAFADKLQKKGLIELKYVTFRNGQSGWVLFMSATDWHKSASGELLPTR